MTNQVWFLFATAILALAGATIWKRRLAARGQTDRFWYFVAENARDTAAPFAAVAIAYVALACVVTAHDSDATAIAAVRALEEKIRSAYLLTRSLKIGRGTALAAVVAVSAAGVLFRYRAWKRAARYLDRTYALFDRYQRTVRFAAALALALSWYSFFSVQSAALAGRLQLRIKTADATYHDLVETVAGAVENQASVALAGRIQSAAPAQYRQIQSAWKAGQNQKQSLALDYPRLTERYRFSFDQAEPVVSGFRDSMSRVDALAATFAERVPAANTGVAIEAPGDATTAEIVSELAAFGSAAERIVLPEVLRVMDSPAGKKIIPGLLGVAVDPKRIGFITRLVSELPVLEPLLDVFTGAVTKDVSNRATARARSLVEAGLRRGRPPADAEVIDAGAALVRDLPVHWDAVPSPLLDSIAATVAAERAHTDDVKAKLMTAAERARPKAEAQLRAENQELVRRLRKGWPPEAGRIKVVGLDRMNLLGRAGQGRVASASLLAPLPGPPAAEKFIEAATSTNDPWKQNEVLTAAVKAVEGNSSSVDRLAAMSGVADRYHPGSAAAREITGQLEAARPPRPVVLGGGLSGGGHVGGSRPGWTSEARPITHESYHPVVRTRVFVRR